MKVVINKLGQKLFSDDRQEPVEIEVPVVPRQGDDIEIDDEHWGAVYSTIWSIDTDTNEVEVQVNVR